MTEIQQDEDFPVLYVLMRTDAPDYQPGKSMAQANHAGTKFVTEAGKVFKDDMDHPLMEAFRDWIQEGDGFGTCIVLACDSIQLMTRTAIASNMGLMAGTVLDLTYPVRDGHRMQALEVDTCGYIFGMKSVASLATNGLRLFKGDEHLRT